MTNPIISSSLPPASNEPMPLTLMQLSGWAVVSVTGQDASKYLQGQLTCDFNSLSPEKQTVCAHCDAKGKVWSNLRLFSRGEDFAYILRKSLVTAQVTELKKYAIFSKIVIATADDLVLVGLAGTGAREALEKHYPQVPNADTNVVQHGDSRTTLLYIAEPTERFLLVMPAEQQDNLLKQLPHAKITNGQQWLALDIAAGLPIIDEVNSAQFIPQALNIQALGGISFTKGCYTGQEMVARAKYRGANKRALYWLAGKASRAPAIGDELELQLGENWRRTGSVLAASQFADGSVWIQAVLNNDLEPDSVLRVREDESSQLSIQPLPYSLTEDK